jgi:uncharacterized phage-associated protein
MLIQHEREKLVEAVVFFAQRVRKLGKTKLFKLLYFLDFEHYRDTGRAVTGLDYFAWPMGPVPKSLFEELEPGYVRWDDKLEFQTVQLASGKPMLKVTALGDFIPQHFSRRELRILNDLATEYRDSTADEMVEATHVENRPWHEIYEVRGLRQEQIPYELAFRKQDGEVMQGLADERSKFIKAFAAE